jgi:hypothetical protein
MNLKMKIRKIILIEFQIEARFTSEKNIDGALLIFILSTECFNYFMINCWQIIFGTHRLNYKILDYIKESVKLRV